MKIHDNRSNFDNEFQTCERRIGDIKTAGSTFLVPRANLVYENMGCQDESRGSNH